MPTKSAMQPISTVASQKDTRELATVRDQHKSARFPDGRPWWGYVELPANPHQAPNFVGELQPGDHEDPFNSQWSAPWVPDAKYMKPDARKGRVSIEYGAMINDYERARREYYDKAVEIAYEKGWPAPEYNGPVDHRFRAVLGPIPQSVKVPQAALAGDPWILGFSDQCDDDLLRAALTAKHVRTTPVPVSAEATGEVVTLTASELEQKIADAAAKAVESALKAQTDARMAKARAAKDEKSSEKKAA